MEVKTKFGPAAILMDNTGAKMGIVKKMTIEITEGSQEPVVTYSLQGNGNVYNINEKEAIQLVPSKVVPANQAPVASNTTTAA